MNSQYLLELAGADGKLIRGDRVIGKDRQILFITGFLSKRWGNKSKALVQWCQEKGWGFCCYDVRGFGDSEIRKDSLPTTRCLIGLLMRGRFSACSVTARPLPS